MYTKQHLFFFALIALLHAPLASAGHLSLKKDNLDLDLSAEVGVQAGARTGSDRADSSLTKNNEDLAFDSSARVAVKATLKSGDLAYGLSAGLTPQIRSFSNSSLRTDTKTYLFVESPNLGRVQIGSDAGAAEIMNLSAASVAAATGGVNGDWSKYFAFGNDINPGDFIVTPALPLDNTIVFVPYEPRTRASSSIYYTSNSYAEKSRKITYLSPVMNGFQFGVSYIPDAANIGVIELDTNKSPADNRERNAVSGGITWQRQLPSNSAHYLKLSLVGEYGRVRKSREFLLNGAGAVTGFNDNIKVHATKAVGVGALLDLGKKLFTASFTWLGKTGQIESPVDVNRNKVAMANSWHATAGMGLKFDKIYSSLTAYYATADANKSWGVSGGLNYEIIPGFSPYAEVSYVNLKGQNTGGKAIPTRVVEASDLPKNAVATREIRRASATSSRGLVFILGTKIKF